MKKKTFLWLLEACLLFVLAACGNDAPGGQGNDSASGGKENGDALSDSGGSVQGDASGVLQESGGDTQDTGLAGGFDSGLSGDRFPVSIAADMLAFASDYGDVRCGDGYLELSCPEGLSACPDSGSGLYFFRDGIYCGCLFHAEFEEPCDESWKENAAKCGVGAFSNMNASWQFLYEDRQPQRYVYAGTCAVYTFGDTEFLQKKEILAFEEALKEEAALYVALIVPTGARYGYYLEVSQRLVSGEMLEQLLGNMTVSEEAFTDAGAGTFTAASAKISMTEHMPTQVRLPENENGFFEPGTDACALAYDLTIGSLHVRLPEGLRGLRCGDGQWLIYDNYDNRTEVGYAKGISMEGFSDVEEALAAYGQEQETMPSQAWVRKTWTDEEEKYLLLLHLYVELQ